MMVGSLQGASKNTVSYGEQNKYGGLVFTKNIDPQSQKMPSKVIEDFRDIFLHRKVKLFIKSFTKKAVLN